LFLESRRVPSVRFYAAFVDLQQLVPSDDAGVGFPHPCARHEQLRERVGDAPAFGAISRALVSHATDSAPQRFLRLRRRRSALCSD
jgi:hypothetical protein